MTHWINSNSCFT